MAIPEATPTKEPYLTRASKRAYVFGRPEHYESLLLHPINDDPSVATGCYSNWEFDHGNAQRFYVGGLRWFKRVTGISGHGLLSSYGAKAADVARSETNWWQMPESRDLWAHCAPPQFANAREVEPMFFQKGALVILACELALVDHLNANKATIQPVTPDDVYRNMALIPATWNLNDFDEKYLAALTARRSSVHEELLRAAGQDKTNLLRDMTRGHTVTFETASSIKTHLDERVSDAKCGQIRAKPGRHLGRKGASELETIDAD